MIFPKKRARKKDSLSHRIFKPGGIRTPKYRARRIIILGILVITLLFLGKILLSFFDFEHVNVSIALFGNSHYTEGQIYDVLGENLGNIITDSEAKNVAFLKENLSYIEDAHISKNFVRRQLTIEITEREPFARVKHTLLEEPESENVSKKKTGRKSKDNFFLVDGEGYVLESITPEKYNHMTLILDEGIQEPQIGKQIKTGTTQLGIHILKLVMLRAHKLTTDLKTIDARNSQKIIIDTESLDMPVWIASDLIETGLHHVDLFVKQQGLSILQKEKQMSHVNTLAKTRAGNTDIPLPKKYTYLDARYEDTLYLGGANK